MHAFLDRLGRLSAHRHWVVLGTWLVVLVGVLVLRNLFGGDYVNDYTVPGSESSDGLDHLDSSFPQAGGYAGSIVFHNASGKVSDDAKPVKKAMTAVAGLDHVLSSSDPLQTKDTANVSKDGTTVKAPVSFDVVPASLDADYLDELDAAVKPAVDAGLEVEYGGSAGEIGKQESDRTSEIIGISMALILLLLMFGSLVATAVPLLAAIFSVGSGICLLGLIAAATNLPTTAPTVATLLGLGVAIDYGLFLVARHIEHLEDGVDVVTSIGRTASTSGSAIVVAGTTVVIAILGLYVSGVPFVGALGMASAIVVAVTMLSALTLVPALLGLAQRRVLRRSERAAATAGAGEDPEAAAARMAADHDARAAAHERSVFARWGRRVSDRPWPWALGAVVVLGVLTVPLFSIQLGQLDAGTDPESDSSRKAYDLIADSFGPGANGPITIVMDTSDDSQKAAQNAVSKLQKDLTKTDGVAGVGTPALNKAGDTAVITLVPTTEPKDAATQDLVDTIRSDVLTGFDEKTWAVGTVAGYVDFTEKVAERMPWLIGAVVLLALVLLTAAFRSLVIGIKAAVLNLLSVGAAYGLVVAVFQWGWGSSWVGIEETVPIPSFVPMLMFAIVFGLSMDYEVFLLSRVHEAYLATRDSHRAVAIGIGATARVITTAAAIMVTVFTSFVLSDDPTVKMLAVGMAGAVLIDATVVRMILVPAAMSLLGDAAWWIPRWLDRVLPDLQLEGPVAAPTEEPLAPEMTR
jgi:RND superfamily putative drug exporter